MSLFGPVPAAACSQLSGAADQEARWEGRVRGGYSGHIDVWSESISNKRAVLLPGCLKRAVLPPWMSQKGSFASLDVSKGQFCLSRTSKGLICLSRTSKGLIWPPWYVKGQI